MNVTVTFTASIDLDIDESDLAGLVEEQLTSNLPELFALNIEGIDA